MPDLLFPAPEWPLLPMSGTAALFPVRRVFCVGRNYEAHAREMGHAPDRSAPFYFTKSALAVTLSDGELTLPYPPGTADWHHEVELVAALGAPGFRVDPQDAMGLVAGWACGLDMTRRDLQAAAKDKGRPWDTAKDVEDSAVIGPLTAAADWTLAGQAITLSVDGAMRQQAVLSDMIWSLPELIADLSRLYHLAPGDLIFTGTPAGVGAVGPGARLEGRIDGLAPVTLRVGAPE